MTECSSPVSSPQGVWDVTDTATTDSQRASTPAFERDPVAITDRISHDLMLLLVVGGICPLFIQLVDNFALGVALSSLVVAIFIAKLSRCVPLFRDICAQPAYLVTLILGIGIVGIVLHWRGSGYVVSGCVSLALVALAPVLLSRPSRLATAQPRDTSVARVAIFGTNPRSAALAHRLRLELHRRVHIVGVYHHCNDQHPVTHAGIVVRGGVAGLIRDAAAGHFGLVVAADDQRATLPPLDGTTLFYSDMEPFGLLKLRLLSAGHRHHRARKEALSTEPLTKRVFDRAVALMLLVALAPAFLLIMLAIRCETNGPIFFRQVRKGLHDRPFRIWKFRTMHHRYQDLDARNQTDWRDMRVTRVGWLLRRTSMDELPQLVNVIMGEMSLVGPRPHAPDIWASGRNLAEAVPAYPLRHVVKPGITGLAQIHGYRGAIRSEDHLAGRVAHDLFYIETWSFWLDLKILCLTITRGLFGPDAY